jgi:5S rRNA maturation endonuclease (ribonuclease M5)
VYCHAGCEQSAVIDALKSLGLWSERSFKKSIVATYNYTAEDGTVLYQVCRTEPKDFFQRRADGYGGWINRKGERQVLYHLREVLEAAIVFIVEGERDVETLRSHGFVATTNAGGANAPWLPQFTETLRGREIVLIPDRDKPGRERVIRIAHALHRKVPRLVILELEDGKDVTEWFGRGHSELELLAQLDAQETAR